MNNSRLTQADVERRLKASGVLPTAQRIAIARYALCEADHPTAEQIKVWADQNFPKMSMATVYNTLVDTGLLKKISVPHMKEALYDDNVTEHHHFFDEKTGKIMDVDSADVKVTARLPGIKISEIAVFMRGRRK